MVRVAAGAFGFLIFSHAFDGPDPYSESNAELAAISAGECGVSGSAFAPRIQRRSTDFDCRSHDCPPKYCLCGSNRRTSYTGSPNAYYPCLTRSPRTTKPRRPPACPGLKLTDARAAAAAKIARIIIFQPHVGVSNNNTKEAVAISICRGRLSLP